MGKFSELQIDMEEREQAGRVDYAVILSDDTRPAELWEVLGEIDELLYLKSLRRGIYATLPASEVWIIA